MVNGASVLAGYVSLPMHTISLQSLFLTLRRVYFLFGGFRTILETEVQNSHDFMSAVNT